MHASLEPVLLIVDDHPLVRAGIRATLQHHLPHAQIQEAGCATEAFAALAANPPHLALVDVNLPGTSGLDLTRHMQARNRSIKLLILTADADPWVVSEALKAGASGFVSKTCSGDTLTAAVQAVLNGQIFLCPESERALRRTEASGVPAACPPPGPGILSAREREVLRHLARGENTKTIAALLDISPKTVETHRQHIMRKLGANSVAALVRYAIDYSLTPS